MSFNPHPSPDRTCWYCHFYAGMTAQGTAALCNLPNAARVRCMPENGCSGFMREAGSDDAPLTRASFGIAL